MSKVVKILRDRDMLPKENEVEEIAKEIDGMGRSSRKGSQKNRNRKQKKGNSTKPVEKDTTLKENDNNNAEKNIEPKMSLNLVELSPSLVPSSEDPSGEDESTDGKKWQTVQSRSKRVKDRELESSSTSSQASSEVSDASEVPSSSAPASKKKRRKRRKKQTRQVTAEVASASGRTNDNGNSEEDFQNTVTQALKSIQNSIGNIVKQINDLRRDVTKKISVSQEIALSCWLTMDHRDPDGMSRSRIFHVDSSPDMFDRIRKQYGPVFNLHIDRVIVAGFYIKNLDRVLHDHIKTEVRKHCSPNAKSIEFNIYGGEGNTIEIAEATTSDILTSKGRLNFVAGASSSNWRDKSRLWVFQTYAGSSCFPRTRKTFSRSIIMSSHRSPLSMSAVRPIS